MLLFVQKGAWSRLGVYVVHLSILIILAGAIIGGLYGFQAYVYLPEGRTTEHIYMRYSKEPYPLGFGLRCDRFEKTYYAGGMVKQYRSDLTVLDPKEKAPYQKSIIVNDPLSYRGLTFYQGDSYPTQEFFLEIINRSNGMRQAFRVSPEQEIDWPEAQIRVQIEKLNLDQDGNASQGRITLRDSSSAATEAVWISDRNSRKVSLAGQNLDIYFRQLHSTLLLISKDPGVSTVYAGGIIMIVGLAVSLFFAHRRIWVKITPQGKGQSLILVGGGSNKNKLGFEQAFRKLGEKIDPQSAS
jgi:cytochrome c biogenesis protein